MKDNFITIREAAELCGKSVQTLRRAVKSKKVRSRRKKTPQGYNYLISQESVIKAFKLRITSSDRKQGRVKKTSKAGGGSDYATTEDIQKLQKEIEQLLDKHEKAKDSFSRFMKAFQERFVIMENQLKLLEDPKKKRWYQFWR